MLNSRTSLFSHSTYKFASANPKLPVYSSPTISVSLFQFYIWLHLCHILYIIIYIFKFSWYIFSSVQSLSHIWLFAAPWIAARQASLSITYSQSLLKLMPIESMMPSSHLILCRPLLLLPPIPPSIRGFSNESTLRMRWPKYWSFSFSISPSSEHPGLTSFRMDWLDLLAVQGTLKSLLQHHSFPNLLALKKKNAGLGTY